MNAPLRSNSLRRPPLHQLLLSILVPSLSDEGGQEAQWLRDGYRQVGGDPSQALSEWLRDPPADSRRLLELGASMRLGLAELVALALTASVEVDPLACRVLAWLQSPSGGSRPTLGLIQRIASVLDIPDAMAQLWGGPARRCGLLRLEGESRPLPEVVIQMPVPIALALQGHGGHWPGVVFAREESVVLAPSMRVEAARQARALIESPSLVVRSGHPREVRTACALIAAELGCTAAYIEGDLPPGLGPWLGLVGAMPVICEELAPGESRALVPIDGYEGPVLVAAGLDGSFLMDGDPISTWRVDLPDAAERAQLWAAHVDDPSLAQTLGQQHRTGAFNIHRLGQAARHTARLQAETRVQGVHVVEAARKGFSGALGTLAELVTDTITDEALVLPSFLREELESLCQRCRVREGLPNALGPSIQSRYKPGVRALFVGASGTGKTLAAGWLASQLGLPLYRVDVAATTSKYIGETEKNLAQLFARAEHSEVVLMFDEADSLFGKRTEVKESNDRFANAQTNYLLQRIESFEGIALLTSNSRARFDSAFTRRLDAILDFPLPTPEERRRLWLAHLGHTHALDATDLNRLAVQCDLAGGHVRNVVLAAQVVAQGTGRSIQFNDLVKVVAAEYRKLGKQIPAGLSVRGEAP